MRLPALVIALVTGGALLGGCAVSLDAAKKAELQRMPRSAARATVAKHAGTFWARKPWVNNGLPCGAKTKFVQFSDITETVHDGLNAELIIRARKGFSCDGGEITFANINPEAAAELTGALYALGAKVGG